MKLIELANITAQTTTAGTPINVGTIDRKITCGCNGDTAFQTGANTLTIAQCGYYLIDITAVVTATTAETTNELTLYVNGTQFTSASSSVTLTAVGDKGTHNISKIIRVFPNSSVILSIVPTATLTLDTLNFSAIKIA